MDSDARARRKKAFRAKIIGSEPQLRLNVFRSSKHIYAALIDNRVGKTLVSASEKDIKGSAGLPKTEKAFLVGKAIAAKALKKGFKKVIFDRAGYLYHGRVKRLAEGAREGGLEF